MATWGLHLRIAETLLEAGYDFHEPMFAVGNIGPDCGKPNEDWSQFEPSPMISHWKDEGTKTVNPDRFYNTYLREPSSLDYMHRSFLIGYYCHLLTDVAFTDLYIHKRDNNPLYAPVLKDPQFIWTIKEDWYDLDHVYFRDNPESIFHRVFRHVKDVPNYLDYYPKGAIMEKVNYITDFYQKSSDNLDRTYIYLTMDEMNTFVTDTTQWVMKQLSNKDIVAAHSQ